MLQSWRFQRGMMIAFILLNVYLAHVDIARNVRSASSVILAKFVRRSATTISTSQRIAYAVCIGIDIMSFFIHICAPRHLTCICADVPATFSILLATIIFL